MSHDIEISSLLPQKDEEASLSGSAVRIFTNMTRPLSYLVSQALFPLKHMLAMATSKFAFALKKTMANPTKLFRRQAFSPMDAFKGTHASLLVGLRFAVANGGLRSAARKAFTPYVVNAVVALSMFHSYTATRCCLEERGWEDETRAAFVASLAAGTVQATLNAPLYNLRVGRLLRKKTSPLPENGLLQGLRDLAARQGYAGLFRNYPYLVLQECCSLGAFFVSFEWAKVHATEFVRQRIDPSGKKDPYAWASAACVAGVALFAVGTPFENVHEWHATRSGEAKKPGGVFQHFFREARPKCRRRILLSGLRTKLPLAPVAGLPLLAYEVMTDHGYAPVLHSDS